MSLSMVDMDFYGKVPVIFLVVLIAVFPVVFPTIAFYSALALLGGLICLEGGSSYYISHLDIVGSKQYENEFIYDLLKVTFSQKQMLYRLLQKDPKRSGRYSEKIKQRILQLLKTRLERGTLNECMNELRNLVHKAALEQSNHLFYLMMGHLALMLTMIGVDLCLPFLMPIVYFVSAAIVIGTIDCFYQSYYHVVKMKKGFSEMEGAKKLFSEKEYSKLITHDKVQKDIKDVFSIISPLGESVIEMAYHACTTPPTLVKV